MPTNQQDIHDAFKSLLDCTPDLSDHDNRKLAIVRFASMAADILGRVHVLETQSQSDAKSMLDLEAQLAEHDYETTKTRLDALDTRTATTTTTLLDLKILIGDHEHDHTNKRLDSLESRANSSAAHLNNHVNAFSTSKVGSIIKRLDALEGHAHIEVVTASDRIATNLADLPDPAAVPAHDPHAPYQMQLDSILTFARESRRHINRLEDIAEETDALHFKTRLDDLASFGRGLAKRTDDLELSVDVLPAQSIDSRLRQLEAALKILAPLLLLLPPNAHPEHDQAPEEEPES